ncbi:MAG TPA: hypothetical protein VNO24_15750, partial [Blastocatellia bacterium]|nr:hypothetical protein [Blastocatellia bacterium]
MNIKRAVFMAVVVVAVAALAVPLVGLRTSAAGSAATSKAAATTSKAAVAESAASTAPQEVEHGVRLANGQEASAVAGGDVAQGNITPEVRKALGLTKTANAKAASEKIARRIRSGSQSGGDVSIQSGEPEVLAGNAAFSAALLTTIGGRDNQFSEVALLADWDGREDCAADRSKKVDDFSGVEPEIDFSLTRTAISEHTIANGFNENVFFYGDTVGNVWVGVDTTGDGRVDSLLQINLPTTLNAFGTINSDDQVTVTGLAVNPVADLGSFGNVNGSYVSAFGGGAPGTSGVTGEILYVSYYDSEGGLRLTANNTLVRSGVLAFPISDLVSPAAAPPGVISGAGFPVTVGGAFGVAFSVFANVAGVAVDDDGSVYFQNVDLIQFTGANIVKITSQDDVAWQDRSLATNGFPTITTLTPTNGNYGTASGPNGGGVSQINRFTNYSGTSTLFGNIVAIASGGCNVLYAATSRSFVAGDVSFDQLTEGLFPAPAAFGAAGTPSMVISFADCSGAFDICSGDATGSVGVNVGGIIPAADGFADVAQSGLTLTPGVNNFRIFVQGNGPNLAPAAGGTAIVPGTPTGLLKIDMQIDYTVYSGLVVNQENTVFVVSGGTPAGIGKNPSPMLGEILCFEDKCPADRRADFVDLRGDTLPNPPSSGSNVGDGDSDRFDHIFWQSPLDQLTVTPAGIAGLSGGFLRYTNRLAPHGIGIVDIPAVGGVSLGATGGTRVLGDDTTTEAAIIFERLDPSHQVAGGDDQNPPFRGDDDNGAGSPTVPGPLSGGFEFVFGGPVGTANCVWNGFFWNSNGNITFGGGDTDNTATVPEFRTGRPKIAPAWTDLNPNARAASLRNFPVMALGFANINAFKVRWINVPKFGDEGCTGTASSTRALIQSGVSNTFSVTLFDDGTGIDENANQPLNPANPIGNNAVPFDLLEGPTDLRFTREPNTGVIVGCPPRPEGSGIFIFDFCRMDLLGTSDFPVITGYSIGGLNPLNPPGLCEINLSEAARAADTSAFGVIQGTIGAINCACCIGEGTEPTIFELFNEGLTAGTGSGGEVTFARPDFDLRFEGNDAVLCTSARQRDLNRGRVCFFGVGCAPPANPLC